jgi:hypothetical protein
MRRNVKSFSASLALVALFAAGCAQRAANGTPPPNAGHGLILRIDVGGGFVALQTNLRQVPMFALYADGRMIVPGPQIEIYPGPALPNLQMRTVSEEGIQAILAEARAAGLLGPDRHYDGILVADAPTTTFTVVSDVIRHTVSVQALGFEQTAPDATQEEIQARAKLSAFQSRLGDLQSWLPAGSLGPEGPFVTDELRVHVMPYQPVEDLSQKTVAWPLGSFKGFTTPPDGDIRCGTVTGNDLEAALAAAGNANELTPWRADGERWTLVFRPLLPDESGCA